MTKYKYNVNKNTIEKDKKFFAYLNSVDAHTIVNELNALHEENTRLKEIISANRTITIPYTITDEKLFKKLKEMFKEDLE